MLYTPLSNQDTYMIPCGTTLAPNDMPSVLEQNAVIVPGRLAKMSKSLLNVNQETKQHVG